MKQDRFLIGILVFIGALVVASVALFFVRGGKPEYGPEDTPGGVVNNYTVALQLHDYQRAYGYLADNDGKPSYDTFQQAFVSRNLDPGNSALQTEDVQMMSSGEAWVNISVQSGGSGPFDNGWSNADHATLVKQNDAWKITYLPNPYWGYDWYQPTPTPVKQ